MDSQKRVTTGPPQTPEQRVKVKSLLDEWEAGFKRAHAADEAEMATKPKLYDAKNGDCMPTQEDDGIPPDLPKK